MADLIDCIHTNAQIYFHISDVLSCSENITDYINFVSKVMQVHLTAAVIELQDKQTHKNKAHVIVSQYI